MSDYLTQSLSRLGDFAVWFLSAALIVVAIAYAWIKLVKWLDKGR